MTDKLKKAAILIASMDAASADALLDEMPPEEAARVRNAVMELEEIDPEEQHRIMQEFVRRKSRDATVTDGGVELDLSPEGHMQSVLDAAGAAPPNAAIEAAARPFQFLHDVEIETLAGVLRREHPQTTAIVVAHLSAPRAADVLRRLPAALQTEALMRIARLSPPHHEVIRDIEHEMRALLSNRTHRDPLEAEGLARVEAILQATSAKERRGLVRDLTQCDQTLARRLAGQPAAREATETFDSRNVEALSPTAHLSARNTSSPDSPTRRDLPAEDCPTAHAPAFSFRRPRAIGRRGAG